MVAAPYYGVLEMQTVSGENAGEPGYVICRPLYMSDVAGDFAKFLDDSSFEYTAEADLWITDTKLNAAGTDTNDVQLYLKSNPVRYENWTAAMLTSVIVRPRPFFVRKGTKIQLKQLKR
jgi:hypothetical protein